MSIPWRRAPCNIKQSNSAPLAPRSLYSGNAVFTNGAVAGGGEKGVYLLCSLFYSAVRWDWHCPEISVRSRRRFGTCKKWKSNP